MSCINFPPRHFGGLDRPFIKPSQAPSQARKSDLWLPRYGCFRMGGLQHHSVVWATSRRGSVHKLTTMATTSSIKDEIIQEYDESFMVAQNLMFSRFISMAFQTAISLGVPDVLASAEGRKPMSAEEILRQLPTKSTPGPASVQNLQRVLSPLAREGLFSESLDVDEQPVYGLTQVSEWFIRGNPLSIAPLADLMNGPDLVPREILLPEAMLDETTTAFKQMSGVSNVYEMKDPAIALTFQEAMESYSNVFLKGALDTLVHSGVLDGVNTMVDVGGGRGHLVAQVVASNQRIQGINFDLPDVIAAAPAVKGVQHVAGSFFKSVPSGDAMFMKWIIHNYGDEEAIQILTNCYKALPANGKVILAEYLKDKHDNSSLASFVERMDLVMLAYLQGARERSKEEYQYILAAAGFPRCNIIQMPDGMALIEALKE